MKLLRIKKTEFWDTEINTNKLSTQIISWQKGETMYIVVVLIIESDPMPIAIVCSK